MKITWLGQGGFLFESGAFRLVVDPYLSDCVQAKEGPKRLHPFPIELNELNPDMVLVTHDHIDHLDPDGIPQIREAYPACRYAGPQRAHDHFLAMDIPAELVTEIPMSSTHSFGPFTASSVFASHSDPTSCGYVIECENKRIYLSGDTLFDERLLTDSVKNADLMLICINGKLGNMNRDEALRCVKSLSPAMALPMHYGLFAENTEDPEPFVNECKKMGVDSFAMTPGKEFEL